MSYSYTSGQGLSAFDPTRPNGATEAVDILDDAIRQIVEFLTDTTPGVAFNKAAVISLFRANTSGALTVPIDGNTHQLTNLNAKIFDVHSDYNTGSSSFVAPVAGYYDFNFFMQFDNAGGDASQMQITCGIYKNGVYGDNSQGVTTIAIANPPGSRWFTPGGARLLLAVGDVITLGVNATDGTNTSNLTYANGYFDGHLENTNP